MVALLPMSGTEMSFLGSWPMSIFGNQTFPCSSDIVSQDLDGLHVRARLTICLKGFRVDYTGSAENKVARCVKR